MISVIYTDDEPDLLEIGRLFLERTGRFSVDTAISAQEALEKIRTNSYDAIISDYQMPGMNGIEFLREVRASGNSIPFVIFTGRGREEIVIQALNEGADFYLQKGGDPLPQFAELAHKVEMAVQRRRAEASIRDHERREADIINFLPDATFAIDTNGIVIAWNRAMERMTGVRAGDIIGKGNYEYALPFYRERRPILIDLVLREDPAAAARYPFIKKEGNTLFSEITIPHFNGGCGAALWFTASPLYNIRGTIVGAIESIREITERKKAEEALNESEEFLSNLIENIPDMIFVKDTRDLRFVRFNRAGETLLGYPREELIGKNDYDFFPREEADFFTRKDRAVIESRTPLDIPREKIQTRLHGERVLHTKKIPILDDAGKPRYLLGISEDITERIKAEEALQQSEIRFRSLIQNASDIIRILDRDGKIVYESPAAVTILGYPAGENLGKDPLTFIHPDDRDRVTAALSEVYSRTNRGISTEFRIRRADGTYIWVDSIGMNLLDVPAVNGIVITTRPIDQRKKMEEALRESELRYRNIFENAIVGIFRSTPEGKFLQMNPAFARMFGYDSPGAMMAALSDGRLKPYVRQKDSQDVSELRSRGERIQNYEAEFYHRSGSRIWISFNAIPVRNAAGEILYYEGTAEDITERKQQDHILRVQLDLGIVLQKLHGLAETLDTCLDAAIDISGMDAGGIYLVDERTGALDLFVSRNLGDDFIRTIAHYPAGSVNAQMVMGGEPRYTLYTGTGVMHTPVQEREGLKATAVVPITYGGRVIGCLNIASHAQDTVPAHSRLALETLALRIGNAIGRIRADDALAASEERYRNIVEDQTEFISRFRPDGTHVFVNEAYCRYFGLKREEILGNRFQPDIYPEDRDRVRHFFQSLIPDHPIDTIEHRIVMPDGEVRWQRWSDRAIFDEHGDLLEYQSVGRDITEWKLAEEALRESQQRNAAIIAALPDLLFVLSRDGTYLDLQAADKNLLAAPPDHLIGKNIASAGFDPAIAAVILKAVSAAIDSGSLQQIEYTLAVPAGVHDFEARIVKLGDDRVLGIVRDITEQIAAEKARKESEERFRSLYDNMIAGVVVYDPTPDGSDFIIRDINRAAEKIEQVKKEEVIGHRVTEIFPGVGEFGILEVFRQVAKTGVPARHPVSRYRDNRIIGWRENYITRLPSGEIVAIYEDVTEKKQAEEALRESRNLLDATERLAKVGGWEWDIEHQTMTWTDETYRIHGFSPSEFTAGSPEHIPRSLACYDPADRRVIESSFQSCAENGIPYDLEFPLTTADNRRIWIRTMARPELSDGRIVKVVGNIMDITERKLVEESLKKSEARFSTLFNVSPVPLLLTAPDDGRILAVNDAAASLFGYSRENMLGKTTIELGIWADPEERGAQLADFRRHGFVRDAEIRIRSGSGKVRTVIFNSVTADSDGAPALISAYYDITDRKQAEEKLVAAYAEYQDLLDHIQDVYYRSDETGRLIRISRSLPDVFGYRDITELLGKNIAETFYYDPAEREKVLQEIQTRGHIANYEVRLKRKDGTPVWISANSHLWHNPDGSVGGVEGTFRDITEQKRVNDTLRQKTEELDYRNRVIGTLLDTVPIGIFMVEATSGKPIIANKRATWLLGRGILPDATEENLAEVYEAYRAGTNERYPAKEMPVIRGMYGESSHVDDMEVVRPDGTRIRLEIFGTPVFDSQGRVAASLVCFLDITDRKQTEEMIHQLAQFPEQNPHPVFRVGGDGTLTYANNPAKQWLAGLSGQKQGQVPERIWPLVTDALENRGTRTREVADESGRVYVATATRPMGEEYVNIYVSDITDRKRAERIIIETNKKLNLLTSITRHDVANQVTILQAFAQIALEKHPDPAIAELLEKIRAAGTAISRQIEFTRTYEELGLHAPGWYAVRDLVLRQKPAGITITCSCDAEIYADPMLEKVFFNLIDNAARHGERVTDIAVRCELADADCVITVEDNGVGVPPELKEKIFEKGYGKHTGFGLFLAREILAITGISLREDGIFGTGARFKLRVPAGGFRASSAGIHEPAA